MQFIFQKKSLILSILFLIFSCFIFIFLYKNINDNERTLQLTQEKWQMEVARRENTKSLIDSVKAVEFERTLLETHFVQSSNIVPLLEMIEKIAREAGTKADVTSVDPAENNSSLEIKMLASGSFETIYKLITLLENSPYSLEFTSADIQNMNAQNASAGKVNRVSQWTASLRIKVLSFVNK